MTAKQLIAGIAVTLACLSASAQPVNLGQNKAFVQKSQRDVKSPSLTTQDKDALIKHLADKYNKPVGMVKRIVFTAINEASVQGFSPLLVLAMIEKESGFRHDVVNTYGAVGLLQVVPRYHQDKLDGRNYSALKDPAFNIKVGLEVLRESVDNAGGNLTKGLRQYSGGSKSYNRIVTKYEKDLHNVVNNGS